MSGVPLLAAVADPQALELVPVSAGLSGAIVATILLYRDRPAGRWQMLSTLAVGALSSVWVGPAAVELAGVDRRFAMVVHFLAGLLGLTLCDLILANRVALARIVMGRVVPDAKVEVVGPPVEKKEGTQ
jgi:hypothetical protein